MSLNKKPKVGNEISQNLQESHFLFVHFYGTGRGRKEISQRRSLFKLQEDCFFLIL